MEIRILTMFTKTGIIDLWWGWITF